LNNKNCFDFDYEPNYGDRLLIKLKQEEEFLSLCYDYKDNEFAKGWQQTILFENDHGTIVHKGYPESKEKNLDSAILHNRELSPDCIFIPFDELEDVIELSQGEKEDLKKISIARTEKVKKYFKENPNANHHRDKFVKNFNKRKKSNDIFVLKMSANHVDDLEKVVDDLKIQFPDDHIQRLFGMIRDLRLERDEMGKQEISTISEQQGFTNLKYDIEILIQAFGVFLNNPSITEDMMFPVQGESVSDD